MGQLGLFGHKAGQFCQGEHLLEMQCLALIDKVQHAVSPQGAGAVTQGCQVAGGIQVAAVGFTHNHRQRFAFLVFEGVHKHTLSALAFTKQPFAVQICHHLCQIVVIGAFAVHVCRCQADAQAIVDRLTVA